MIEWHVRQDGKSIKTFPTRYQCVIWCYEMGFVISCRRKDYLVDGITITEG